MTDTLPEDEPLDELKAFVPEPLNLERMTELAEYANELDSVAREGQFGFQILMMHPEGHVQMATDINNLVQYYLAHEKEV